MASTLYFAYGERHPEVMEAIIGRRPEVESAILPDYELCVQLAANMPAKVQEILGANRNPEEMSDFAAFVAYPRQRARMNGWVSVVSPEELALLDNWDIEGLWMTRKDAVPAKVGPSAELQHVSLHFVSKKSKVQPARQYFGEGFIPRYLNDVGRTKEIATLARALFLEEQQE